MRSIVLFLLLVPGLAISGQPLGAQEQDELRPHILRNVVYAQRGDLALKADVFRPAGEGPFPGVLVVHGGAWSQGNKADMKFVGRGLAEHGYAAMTINYRLAPRYKFPAQIEDCKSAVRWMRLHAAEYKIDPQRIAGYGYSAGGHLVALLATTEPAHGLEGPDVPLNDPGSRLQAAVLGAAPCDFRSIAADDSLLAYWLGATRRQNPLCYDLASPMSFVSADDPPTFFFHGGEDALVKIAGPLAMRGELEQAGVPCEMYVVPDKGHVSMMFDVSAVTESIEFLDKYLKSAVQPSRE